MFIDKDHLLTKLNQLYDTCMPCCVSLYSYPGEGRSRLLGEFLKGKRTLFYKASCVSWQENFRLLSLEYSSLKQFRQSLWLTDIFLST